MTANDLLNMAMNRLNYTDANGFVNFNANADVRKRGLDIVRYVVADIQRIKNMPADLPESLADAIRLPDDDIVRVAPFGVAMMIAQSENDGDSQAYMVTMYNQLRNTVKRENMKIKDVLSSRTGEN